MRGQLSVSSRTPGRPLLEDMNEKVCIVSLLNSPQDGITWLLPSTNQLSIKFLLLDASSVIMSTILMIPSSFWR